jgi:serine/threonine protein kinase
MTWPEQDAATDIVRRVPPGAVRSPDKTCTGKSAEQTKPALDEPATGARGRLAKVHKLMPKVGTKFLDFQLIAELGRGATAKVFLAQQGDLAGRYVALKVSAEAFDESQTLAQLQHTNVVPIYSIHRVSPFLAVCMPYFGSTTFSDVLGELAQATAMPTSGVELIRGLSERHSKFGSASPAPWLEETQTVMAADTTVDVHRGDRPAADLAQTMLPRSQSILAMLKSLTYVEGVLWVISRLADGLAHAHERGILHLDLKPANILLTDEGQPMLLDFNLARDTKRTMENAGPLIGGTVSYMSPEHIRAFRRENVVVDERSDIYSLGLILCELLTGRPAFPSHDGPLKMALGRMLEDRTGTLPEVRKWNKAVTPAVEAIVWHCLEPDPDKRYQKAHELADDLQRQLHHQPLKYAPEPCLRERVRKWFKRHPRLLSSSTAIIALETVVIVALLGFTSMRRQHTESYATGVVAESSNASLTLPSAEPRQ